MPTKKVEEVEEVVAVEADAPAVVQVSVPEEPVIVAPVTKTAKVKGTWTQYYGSTNRWDFVDGQRYELPLDLYNYLKARGNIYDTL